MSLQPCSSCLERKHGKYANTTVAWWNVANKRLAYRLRICLDCYAEVLEPLRVALTTDEFDCPYCHTEPGETADPTYATIFVPNFGRIGLELNTCAADAVQLRSWAVEHGELLQEAPVGGSGPGPQSTPGATDWEAFLQRSAGG